jgi:hypothetical protein
MNRFTVLASILLFLGANLTFAQPASKSAQPSGSLDEQAFTKLVVPFLKEHCVPREAAFQGLAKMAISVWNWMAFCDSGRNQFGPPVFDLT